MMLYMIQVMTVILAVDDREVGRCESRPVKSCLLPYHSLSAPCYHAHDVLICMFTSIHYISYATVPEPVLKDKKKLNVPSAQISLCDSPVARGAVRAFK